jgi:hypothetical protein
MSNPAAVQAIEEQLAAARERLAQARNHEAELLENISHKNFQAATHRLNLLSDMEALEGSIRRNEQRLVAARK